MPTTQVSIINLALAQIGVSGIVSATEDSPAANTVRSIWGLVFEEVLEAAPWNCVKERRALAQNVTVPSGGDWRHQYDLPSNPYCLRVLEILSPSNIPYEIVGRFLFCNHDSRSGNNLIIQYIKLITDFSQLSPMVSVAISLRLAEYLAPILTESPEEKIQGLFRKYQMAVLEARIRNGMDTFDAHERGQIGTLSWVEAGRL